MMNTQTDTVLRDRQFLKFRAYGFLKNLRFFDPFLVLFLRDAGLSFLAIGSLISIREVATNVLEIPTGLFADVFGRRKAMLLGFSAYLVSFVVFFLGSTFWMFALAMLAFSFGETCRSGTHKAMILEYLRQTGHEKHKVFYYGKTRAASQFGSALASLIAAGLVFWTGHYRMIFLASMLPYVLNFLLLASYPKALDGEHISRSNRQWVSMCSQLRATVSGLWRLLKDPCALRGLLSSAGFDALFKSSKDYLQPVIQAQALSLPILVSMKLEQRTALLIGCIYFVIYLATSIASSHAGAVQARLKSLARCINLSLVVGIGLFVIAGCAEQAMWQGLAIAAFLGAYIIQNLRRPMLVGYLADRMPHKTMASGLSVEVQIRTILVAVMAPVLGWLADSVGVGTGIAITSIAVLIAAPLLWVSDKGSSVTE